MLSMADESWLSDLFETVEDDDPRLSQWQRGFIADLRRRYMEKRDEFFLSPKMKVKLQEIEARADR